MPRYPKQEWDGFSISARPSRGIRRFFPLLPYYTGSDLELTVAVSAIEPREFVCKIEWGWQSSGSINWEGIKSESTFRNPQAKVIKELVLKSLSQVEQQVVSVEIE